jgi:hypothetical protein
MLSVEFSYRYAERHYAECRYGECRGAILTPNCHRLYCMVKSSK